jgi:hypothetical protein
MCRVLSSLSLFACTSPLTLGILIFRAFNFYPWVWIASSSGLFVFVSMAWMVYLSWVDVNSMNCMERCGVGTNRPHLCSRVLPILCR